MMRTCEVAIIGLGLMGSSALHSLVRRGADVLGFDPLAVGEANLAAPRTAHAGSTDASTSRATPIPTLVTRLSQVGARLSPQAGEPS